MKKRIASDYRHMPWKNGAGITVEIAVYPEHAQLDDFVWRVSRAQVNDDGEFSRFAGIDRSLALLQGRGMRLQCDAESLHVDEHNPIVQFSGDAKTRAELIDGAIGDFNVMSRRAVCSHKLDRWTGENVRQLPANTVLVYCAARSGKLILGDEVVVLGADESAHCSSDYTLHSDADSVFYCVQILNGN